jgi:hypothetical protein
MRSSISPILSIIITSQFAFTSNSLQIQRPTALELATVKTAGITRAVRANRKVEPERGVAALDQAIKDIGNPFVVACVGARPGDEDSAALVYYRKKMGSHTIAVFATRGEQGEDESLPATPDEVGVVRTRQALEAGAEEGADVYFLNLPDQPIGAAVEQISAAWEKREGLSSLVRFIRTIHPDVLISGGESTPFEPRELAVEGLAARAVEAAADAAQFPEAGSAWSVKRLYLRGTQANHNAVVNVSDFDSIRGLSYERIAVGAREAYNPSITHDSVDAVYYRLERPAEKSSDSAGDSILAGLTIAKAVEEEIAIPTLAIGGGLSLADRRQLAQSLAGKLYLMRSGGSDDDLRAQFGADYFRVERFMRCLEKAIASALGLAIEVQLGDGTVIPGQKLGVKLKFTNGTDSQLAVEFQTPAVFPSPSGGSVKFKSDLTNAEAGRATVRDYEYQAPEAARFTVPHSSHLYDSSFYPVGDGRWPSDMPFGLAFPTGVRVNAGAAIIFLPAITTIDIVPAFELSASPAIAFLKDFETVRTVDFVVRVINHTPGPLTGELWVVPLAVTKDDYEPTQVKFSGKDEKVEIPLKLKVPILKPPLASTILLELRRPRPGPSSALASLKIDVRAADLAVAEDLVVGYISKAGTRSKMAEALRELGCRHELITVENLRFADAGADLKRFDSIIVDRNAYHDQPELARLNDKLLDYVKAGGNLVVLSQQADDWNRASGLGPLPIKLSGQSTSVQMDAARITEDGATVLTQPNKVEAGDLAGWPVGRNSYLPDAWDAQYRSVIGYAPADSTPARSLLLLANAGEGTYLYLAVAMDEAIAARNPGPLRLLSDLLSLAKYGSRPRRHDRAR